MVNILGVRNVLKNRAVNIIIGNIRKILKGSERWGESGVGIILIRLKPYKKESRIDIGMMRCLLIQRVYQSALVAVRMNINFYV